ncbi:MAG: GTP cyclohydrolase II [Bryobacteraceae bacterium]
MPQSHSSVTLAAEASFPTRFGDFRIFAFESVPVSSGAPDEAIAVLMGDIAGAPPLVRIHSQCLTGDVFHSLRCDCRAQLELALAKIGEEGRGLVIYENKEGRGIGLANKIRAYQLQDQGADTVEANQALGFEADLRDYELPAAILRHLGVTEVRLLSNNPGKIQALEQAGVRVVERVPCQPDVASAARYLTTKKEKLGHLLDGF